MQYLEEYNKWKNFDLEDNLGEELLNLSDDEIKEQFYTSMSFGTGGIRGIMGVGNNRFNIYTIRRSTIGLAKYLKAHNLEGLVTIGYDNRRKSREFAIEAAKVLSNFNIKSLVFNELRPTPLLSYAVRHYNAIAGIMITASHNPKQYNGYKVYNKTGAQIDLDEASEIISYINKEDTLIKLENVNEELIEYINEDFDNVYYEEFKKIRVNEVKTSAHILYSGLHGTGSTVIPKMLKKEGFNIEEYLPHKNYDENFTNAESPNPEDRKVFDKIINTLDKTYDIILATDPDTDRIGMSVYHNNEYINLNGNETAVLMLAYILDNRQDIPENAAIYTTNVTTEMINKIANESPYKLFTTLTGFKFIGNLTEINKDYYYLFGAEESNGSLVSDFVRDKDAVQASLLLAEMVSYLKENNKTLIDYLNELYERYGFYKDENVSFMFEGIEGPKNMQKVIEHFKVNLFNLEGFELLKYEDFNEDKSLNVKTNEVSSTGFIKTNLLRFLFADNSWVVVRPSGTEPKLKFYISTNGKTLEEANENISKFTNKINEIINNI